MMLTMLHVRKLLTLALLATLAGAGPPGTTASAATDGKLPIDHVIVIYLENRSFDNLFGLFPGAEGLAQAAAAPPQVDKAGKPYDLLPAVMDTNRTPAAADSRFPRLANRPFDIGQFVPIDQKTGDLVHRFYQEQAQINGGRMDMFAAVSDAGGLAMGYYDGSNTELWRLVQQYTLADHFFHAAFGGSFLNAFWLVCACTPRFPGAPADYVAQLDANGNLVKDGGVTPDGYAVNTTYTVNAPHPAKAKPERLLPNQTMPHIGDRLDARNLTWAWYAGGWNDALAGKPDPLFQFHHQAFAYFQNLADGTDAKSKHLKDESEFFAALQGDRLPNVVFIKPIGEENEHPGYANVTMGDHHTADLVRAVQNSRYWASSAIIITYDENGGYWDHVAPPLVDRWGPGARVPTLIISPYARKGFVDKTPYDTTSILRFIEWRWDLDPLGDRDANANNLLNAFEARRGACQLVGSGWVCP